MFSHLADFSFTRTRSQAFGFYIAWLALAILLGTGTGVVIGLMFALFGLATEAIRETSMMIGTIAAVMMCTGLTIAIIRAKGFSQYFVSYVGIAATVLFAGLGGGLLGLIIPAYLTTRAPEGASPAKTHIY